MPKLTDYVTAKDVHAVLKKYFDSDKSEMEIARDLFRRSLTEDPELFELRRSLVVCFGLSVGEAGAFLSVLDAAIRDR